MRSLPGPAVCRLGEGAILPEAHYELFRDWQRTQTQSKEGLLPVFEKLSYTHRKEYCRWITDAKKEETRLKRLGKAIEMLKNGISTPG